MNVLNLTWLKQGNADQVCLYVDIPYHKPFCEDYFVNMQILKLYGRRTGKLRAKIIPYFDMYEDIKQQTQYGKYITCKADLNLVKFKHLIPQVEKHLSWALLIV